MHPLITAFIQHQAGIPQVFEVSGNPRLRDFQDGHEITHAQTVALTEQKQTPQTGRVGEDFEEFTGMDGHKWCIFVYANKLYYSQHDCHCQSPAEFFLLPSAQ